MMQKHFDEVYKLCVEMRDRIQYEDEFSYVWTDHIKYQSIVKLILTLSKTTDLAVSWNKVNELMLQLKREIVIRPDMILAAMLITQQFPERCMTSPLCKLPMDMFKCLAKFLYVENQTKRGVDPYWLSGPF